MKNAIQDGRVLDITLEAAVESGGVVAKGKLFGIAVSKGAIGDTIPVHVEGVFSLPKAAGTAFAVGDAVEWDGAKVIASTAGVGYVTATGASADSAVAVRLTPSSITVATT